MMSIRRVLWSLVLLGIAGLLLPLVFVRRDAWLQEQVELLGDKWKHEAASQRLLRAGRSAVPGLIAVLSYGNSPVARRRAASLLGEIGDGRAIEPLGGAAEADPLVVRTASEALKKIGTPAAGRRLGEALSRRTEQQVKMWHASGARSRVGRSGRTGWWYHPGVLAYELFQELLRARESWAQEPQIERGIAECELLMGQYAKAAARLRHYLRRRPNDDRGHELLEEAEHEAGLLAKAKAYLPPGYVPYKARECSLWSPSGNDLVVLAAKQIGWPEGADDSWFAAEVASCRLAALRAQGGRCELAFLSAPIDRYDPLRRDWTEVGLWVEDVDGDEDVEVLVEGVVGGTNLTPSHIAVYSPMGRTLRRMLAADGDIPATVADIDGDGDAEIIVHNLAGSGPGRAPPFMWKDIYSSNGHDFVLANERFPDEYCELLQKLATLNDEVPYSSVNLFYLGWAREICERPRQALMAYRAAEANLRVELGKESSPRGWSWTPKHTRQLEQRRRALERRLGSSW